MTEVTPRLKSGKKKPKTPTKTQLLKKCDTLFSKIVRSVGYCENCGATENLQCAHGFSRRYRATRWYFDNAWALCRGCHVYYTHRPLEWDEWMRERMGSWYEPIRTMALKSPNPDLRETLADLSAMWAEIEEAA